MKRKCIFKDIVMSNIMFQITINSEPSTLAMQIDTSCKCKKEKEKSDETIRKQQLIIMKMRRGMRRIRSKVQTLQNTINNDKYR